MTKYLVHSPKGFKIAELSKEAATYAFMNLEGEWGENEFGALECSRDGRKKYFEITMDQIFGKRGSIELYLYAGTKIVLEKD